MLTRLNRDIAFSTLILGLLIPSMGHAEGLDGANTAWIITATALVLFMTIPGLSLFYGGLVRAKKCSVGINAMFCYNLCCIINLAGLWL